MRTSTLQKPTTDHDRPRRSHELDNTIPSPNGRSDILEVEAATRKAMTRGKDSKRGRVEHLASTLEEDHRPLPPQCLEPADQSSVAEVDIYWDENSYGAIAMPGEPEAIDTSTLDDQQKQLLSKHESTIG